MGSLTMTPTVLFFSTALACVLLGLVYGRANRHPAESETCPSDQALLVVDMQNDFVEDGALPVMGGKALVSVINGLMPLFPLVIGTRDWHPEGHGSFFTEHPGAQPYQMGELGGHPQMFWPVHCVQESEGADFVPGLAVNRMQAVFTKGEDRQVDSYSALYDNNHQNPTGLGQYLKKQGVKELFICGLALDYCVRYSAEDAREFVDKVYVIRDATAAVSSESGAATLQALAADGIIPITAAEVPGLLKAAERTVRHGNG